MVITRTLGFTIIRLCLQSTSAPPLCQTQHACTVQHPETHDKPLSGMHILVDAGNGAGGFFATQVLQPLGADITGSQFLDPDGSFPNHVPNPEDPAAMAATVDAVKSSGADMGIVFDTDVDRSGLVDRNGNSVNKNKLIALMAAVTLRKFPGSTIVTDSVTSSGLTKFIQDLGGKHFRCDGVASPHLPLPTVGISGVHCCIPSRRYPWDCRYQRGYKNVINKGIELNNNGTECELMMETSGHGALRENRFLDDGAYMSVKLIIEDARRRWEGRKDIRCARRAGRIILLLCFCACCGTSSASSCGHSAKPNDVEYKCVTVYMFECPCLRTKRRCCVPSQTNVFSQMLEDLEEPVETDEVRLSITDEDFQKTAAEVIDAFKKWLPDVVGWEVDEPNYEGVRVKVMDGSDQTGWVLLRASLHDPLLVVNAESDVQGGVYL